MAIYNELPRVFFFLMSILTRIKYLPTDMLNKLGLINKSCPEKGSEQNDPLTLMPRASNPYLPTVEGYIFSSEVIFFPIPLYRESFSSVFLLIFRAVGAIF